MAEWIFNAKREVGVVLSTPELLFMKSWWILLWSLALKANRSDQASENAKVACYFIYDFPIALVLFFARPNFHVWRDYKLMAGICVVFVPFPSSLLFCRLSFLLFWGEFRGICKSSSCDQVFMQSWFLIMGT